MSIGAVKGVEIGDGFAVSSSTGQEDNDGFRMRPDGHVEKTSNHAGGILGGISDGSDIILRAAVVVEARAALTLAGALLLGTTSRLEYLQKIWKEN